MRIQALVVLAFGPLCVAGPASTASSQAPKVSPGTRTPPKAPPKKSDSCSVIRPWTSAAGDIAAPRAASSAYQGIATKWAVDSVAERRELTAFLANRPSLLGTLSGFSSACPRGGCVCPVPPKVVQTAQGVYALPLDVEYRADSAGTSAAAALFLSRHEWLVDRIYDSLARAPNRAQAGMVTKASAAARVKAARPPLDR